MKSKQKSLDISKYFNSLIIRYKNEIIYGASNLFWTILVYVEVLNYDYSVGFTLSMFLI